MWTAVSLAIAFIAGIAFYVAWAFGAAARGAGALLLVAGGALVYGVVIVAIVAFWFALAWIFRASRPPGMRIGTVATIRLVAGEFVAVARSAPKMIFHRWLMRDPAPSPDALPVLLVHGVLCNAGVFAALARDLAPRGMRAVYSISYGPPLASIDAFALQLAIKVDAVLAATGASKLVLVGHSMGGLVARAYLRQFGGEKIRKVITVGTPHHGSMHSHVTAGTCLSQMRPGSAWLAELNRDEGSPPPAPMVSIWSWHDSMVTPQTSSRLAGAQNVELAGIGHNALLVHRDVFELVATQIGRERSELGR